MSGIAEEGRPGEGEKGILLERNRKQATHSICDAPFLLFNNVDIANGPTHLSRY